MQKMQPSRYVLKNAYLTNKLISRKVAFILLFLFSHLMFIEYLFFVIYTL